MLSARSRQRLLEALLVIACAGYWFGNSGLGLAILWLAGPGRGRPDSAVPANCEGLQPVWMSRGRICLRGEDGRCLEVFRDELNPRDWAALRRRCLNGQPATGRSTSI